MPEGWVNIHASGILHIKGNNNLITKKIMNKLQTGWLYTLTGAVSAVSLAACMPASKPYNIVYIMTDDHTAQMMSCYDNRYIETPNLDRIANDGVRFVNSFVANSLSGPSRACMFTGKRRSSGSFSGPAVVRLRAAKRPRMPGMPVDSQKI